MVFAPMAGDGSDCADVIGSIYDATLDAAGWPAALEAIRAHMRADAALLRVYTPPFETVIQATPAGFDPAYVQACRDELVHEDLFVSFIGSLAPGQITILDEQQRFNRLHATHCCRECMKPQHKPHMLGGPLLRRAGLEVMIGVQRGHAAPAFAAAELLRMTRLVPHLVRALTLSDRLEQASLRACLADAMPGMAVPGMLLFDRRGKVVFLNTPAETLLSGQGALMLRGGHLHALQRTLQHWLDTVTVVDHRDVHCPGWEGSSARFTTFDGSGDLALAVLPWRSSSQILGCPVTDAVTVGVLAPLDGHETYSVQLIQSLFGLSSGEARLTAALVSTSSLTTAAQALAIKTSTARDRLKSVFRKTGFNSQAALVAAVLRSPTRAPSHTAK